MSRRKQKRQTAIRHRSRHALRMKRLCGSKRRHKTLGSAVRHAKSLNRLYEGFWKEYWCPFHRCFHVGQP